MTKASGRLILVSLLTGCNMTEKHKELYKLCIPSNQSFYCLCQTSMVLIVLIVQHKYFLFELLTSCFSLYFFSSQSSLVCSCN